MNVPRGTTTYLRKILDAKTPVAMPQPINTLARSRAPVE
jgi:hypothetical protein